MTKDRIKDALAGYARSEAEMNEMRRRAFTERGIAIITLMDIADPWTKQAVINETRRQIDLKPRAALQSRSTS